MSNEPTPSDLYDAAAGAIVTSQPKLVDFSAGSNLDATVGISVVLAATAIRVANDRAEQSFVLTATGPTADKPTDDLERRITDFGGPERKDESAALATVRITRSSYVGSYTASAGDQFRGTAPDGSATSFEVIANVTLGALDASVDVPLVCLAAGRVGNVPAGTLTTASPTLPAGLAFTMPSRAAGGAPVESDPDYRVRYSFQRLAERPGSKEALKAGALAVPGVTFAEVNDDHIRCVDGGYVSVFIGDPDAGSNTDLAQAVEVELFEGNDHGQGWVAAGVDVLVFGTEREEIDFTITAKKRTTSSVSGPDLTAALIAFLDDFAVATRLYLSAPEASLFDEFSPAGLLSVRITIDSAPTAREIAPSEAYRAIRTAADGSGVTVVLTEV